MKKTLLSLLIGFGVTNHAFADDLLSVYQQALQNDPATLQSQANREAAFSDIEISRAGLLPQVSLSLQAAETYGDLDRSTNDVTLNLSQTIYDRSLWVGLDRAELVASQSDASLAFTMQNLILRTVSAYFDTLQAQDDLAFARAEKRAIARQLEQTKQRFEVGLTAITDVHEAQAQYDTSVAAEISAENAVETNLEALREITGIYHPDLNVLNTEQFSASLPTPANVNDWLKTAEQRNLELLVSNASVDIAKFDIKSARSGHYPTVGISGSANSNDTDGFAINPGAGGSDRFNTYGLTLSVDVPLYTGGRVSANVESAKHRFVATSEDRERIHRAVIRNVRSNYNDIKAAISRIKAFEQAVVSAQSALKATEAGFDVGTRTIVDVLDSTRNLFDARRNLSSARYGYVISVLNLKLAAGTLSIEDVTDINQGLTAQLEE
ncbi:outer membrane channel protein TolC [Paraglaciecola chathamensis]|uniref:Outer membrane channel protein TolC n=1 Tax=Paraglaciecola agarilytica NO2 TaxID=1125747 RepID=A0ABQ0I6L7_9ALTE|nr:outer membrane channel protein TolC [Paraglaciecola agarilytica]GAC04983.1 outer membrane channel protein TolC [Paraglaciecola agarilytica NO2]